MGWPYTQNHKPWHTAVSAACNHTATIISQGGKLSSSWHVNVSRSDLFSRVSFWTPGMDWHHRPPCHACKLWWNGVWIQRHALFCVCTLYYCYIREAWPRAVRKFLSSRLIMNSRRLLNSHRRHKFLRAEASRDIVKFRSLEMVFPGVFKRYFSPRTPCRLVRMYADGQRCRRNVPGVPRHRTVRMFHRSKPV